MSDYHLSFVSNSFLRSVWHRDYELFRDTPEEAALLERLKAWSGRKDLKETSAEAAFIEAFFCETWGYSQTGRAGGNGDEFSLWPKFGIAGAGEKGSKGFADLAIGHFEKAAEVPIPQILCEFKDVGSDLDAPQKRKGNNRSPVRQCLDYLSQARGAGLDSDPIRPTWGIVTDMNEFRLYWHDRGHRQSIRFVIQAKGLFGGKSLIRGGEAARFERFLFLKCFHRDTLLARTGRCALVDLINRQRFKDRDLENQFYEEYRALREKLYLTLLEHNGEGTDRYPGTRGRLVRLAQKILDRCIFIFFCEDMGQALAFPPKLFQEFLRQRSVDQFFEPVAATIWTEMLRLFDAMNEGKAFGGKSINQFNGGLFASDPALERLKVPNSIFCQHMQGTNEASLNAHKETLLYLCATYNYASDLGVDDEDRESEDDPNKRLGLYTLGRIFEQSITELEILEAEADGRPSINKESKRKRDGVYYTPEWVVERIVDETLGPRLAEIKRACGWPEKGEPTLEAIDRFAERLKTFTVLDPACGSGAFLITALRYLLDAWHEVEGLRRQVISVTQEDRDDAALVAEILKSNIYGVDINVASVEISRLALWLHTARGDKPLSSLDRNIRDGNSLIDGNFYRYLPQPLAYNDEQKERVNTFDWEMAFPEVFARGGFDAIVGNPPYVKFQNFRRVHADMAEYLREGRPAGGHRPFESTRTGLFDLYLPFIEKGIQLLNDDGRLGYIAPSLWIANEYGEGLRNFVERGRHLDRWIDFKAFQVFEEAITYTALQFFSKRPNEAIRVVEAPEGDIPPNAWDDPERVLTYGDHLFGDRWLLLTGVARKVFNSLYSNATRLECVENSESIFVGIQTSADSIYHLEKLGPGRYRCHPTGKPKPPPYEVDIEDAIMKPLVSGADVSRYVSPTPRIFVLFPYLTSDTGTHLLSQAQLETGYPKAWKFLVQNERQLRDRESGRMDIDSGWWGYNYPKNLDKQHISKIMIPRLVALLDASIDSEGQFFLDNVDVCGIAAASDTAMFFLAGIINSRVLNFAFRRISKPFRGNYLSANRQFIAPLPIPRATEAQREDVARRARNLQTAHTARRDKLDAISKRLVSLRSRAKPERWLFPEIPVRSDLLTEAPARLATDAQREWADARIELATTTAHDRVGSRLRPGAALSAAFEAGELSFSIDGIKVVDRVFVDQAEGEFIVAQWKVLASTFPITDSTSGKKLANALRKLAVPDNPETMRQVIRLESELAALEVDIDRQEKEMNDLVDSLFGLTDADKAIIAKG
jgi:Eco57I restriction-modification methylase/TaqI-like C-terminal specificity domain